MLNTPLVSVVLCFYNADLFLIEAIEGVINQSYFRWELIMVDDGSVDNGPAIAKSYETRYPDKICYVDHAGHVNKGLSYSRNAGIEKSKGEYVALLDADDVWLAEKLERQVKIMQENIQAAMLCEASEYWYSEDDDITGQTGIIQIGCNQDQLYKPMQLISQLYPLGPGSAPVPSGIMIRYDAFARHGLFEPSFNGIYQLYEDQAFLHKIYLNDFVYISSQCNHRYRQHINSLVGQINANGHYHRARNYFLVWLMQYAKEKGIRHKGFDHLLEKAMMPYRHSYFSAIRARCSSFVKSLTVK